jgi:hypothetical protein
MKNTGRILEYIKGLSNVMTIALSRLDSNVSSTTANFELIAELHKSINDKHLQEIDYPLSTQIIVEYQQHDQMLVQYQPSHPGYCTETVDGFKAISFTISFTFLRHLGNQSYVSTI